MRHHSMALGGLLAACLLGALTASAVAAEAGDVVARVNGEAISQTQFEQLVRQRTEREASQLTDAQRRQLLEELVTLTILAQDAREQGLAKQPEVVARLENLQRAVLAQAVVGELTGGEVSEEQIQALYKERVSESQRKEFHARHILTEEKAEAEAVIAQLEDGADFAELAREHSTGPTGPKGGDLGWFAPENMVAPFSDAVAALEKGEFTKTPVQTQFGWHVILLEDTRTAPAPALEDIRDQLRTSIVREKVEAHISDLREQADVEYEAKWAGDGDS